MERFCDFSHPLRLHDFYFGRLRVICSVLRNFFVERLHDFFVERVLDFFLGGKVERFFC